MIKSLNAYHIQIFLMITVGKIYASSEFGLVLSTALQLTDTSRKKMQSGLVNGQCAVILI